MSDIRLPPLPDLPPLPGLPTPPPPAPPELQTQQTIDGVGEAMVLSQILDVAPNEAYELRSGMSQQFTGKPQGLGSAIVQSWNQAVQRLEYDKLGYTMKRGELNEEQQARFEHLREQVKSGGVDLEGRNLLGQALVYAAQTAPGMLNTASKGAWRGLLYGLGLAGTAAALGQAGPQAVIPEEIGTVPGAFGVGLKLGWGVGSAEESYRIMSGGLYLDMIDMGVETGIANRISDVAGLLNAAIEVAQIDELVKTIPGGKELLKGATLKAAAGAQRKIHEVIGRSALRYGATVGTETLEEVAQEIVNIVSEDLGEILTEEGRNRSQLAGAVGYNPKFSELYGGDDTFAEAGRRITGTARELASRLISGESMERLAQTAKGAALGFGVLGMPGHVAQTLNTIRETHGTEQDAPFTEDEAKEVAERIESQVVAPVQSEERAKTLHDDIESEEERRGVVTETEVETANVNAEQRDLVQSYEREKDLYFANRDERIFTTKVEQMQLQKQIREAVGEEKYSDRSRDIDRAIQIAIDSDRNPAQVVELYDQLTAEQQRIVDLSRNLPDEVRPIVQSIRDAYREIGLEAKSDDVIRNVLDNYVGRVWDLEGRPATEVNRKFGTKTRHAKQRVFDTIVEGWAAGYQLKIEGATGNLAVLKDEMIRTLENKRFLRAMTKAKGLDGEPLITTSRTAREGYEKIEHPNFRAWRYAGRASAEGDQPAVRGKNVFQTKEGAVLEAVDLYAPKDVAKNLNRIFGTSKLSKFAGVRAVTTINAVLKRRILQWSLFHWQAYVRSYFYGVHGKEWSEMNPFKAKDEGLKAIQRLEPGILLGVRNGLTLGVRQDWNEINAFQKGLIGQALDKIGVATELRDKLMALRASHEDWMFNKWGAGLKAKAFLIELRHQTQKYPNQDPNVLAKRVANLINDDFGGLHLERLGRDPTIQHIFRLFALSPDWTESNVRTMVKTIMAGTKEERALYQRFWVGALAKGAAATVLANFALAGGDVEELKERYTRSWRNGNLKWMEVDITPIYQLFGGEDKKPRYFNLFGHFRDPIKFVSEPVRSAQHKGSVAYRILHEALTGVDWAGRRFTTLRELVESGETVKWGPGGSISYEQLPSYVMSQVIGTSSVQFQNLLAWLQGEEEAFDAVSRSAGFAVTTGYRAR